MNKIVVIIGPTGVGKTKLSISLAKYLDAVVINADSMQVYRNLNIGTAKLKKVKKKVSSIIYLIYVILKKNITFINIKKMDESY